MCCFCSYKVTELMTNVHKLSLSDMLVDINLLEIVELYYKRHNDQYTNEYEFLLYH